MNATTKVPEQTQESGQANFYRESLSEYFTHSLKSLTEPPPLYRHLVTLYLDHLLPESGRDETSTTKLRQTLKKLFNTTLFHQLQQLPINSLIPDAFAKEAAALVAPFVSPEIMATIGRAVVKDYAGMLGLEPHSGTPLESPGDYFCGGDTATIKALLQIRSIKYLPVAVRQALKEIDIYLDYEQQKFARPQDYDYWQLSNFSIKETVDYAQLVITETEKRGGSALADKFRQSLHRNSIDFLGKHQFFNSNYQLHPPVIIAPSHLQDSLKQVLHQAGWGETSLISIPITNNLCLDSRELQRILVQLKAQAIPVLAVIATLGDRNYGVCDPLFDLISMRNQFAEQGFYFALVLRAHWGAHLCSLLQQNESGPFERSKLQENFSHFPSQRLYENLISVASFDYLALNLGQANYSDADYSALLVNRTASDNQRLVTLPGLADQRIQSLHYTACGRFAALSSAFLCHQLLPLKHDGYGRIYRQIIQCSERFFAALKILRRNLQAKYTLALPVEPDSSIICIAINPAGNRSLINQNLFTERLYRTFRDSLQPEFVQACTLSRINLQQLNLDERDNLFGLLQLDCKLQAEAEREMLIIVHDMTCPALYLETCNGDPVKNYLDKFEQSILGIKKGA